jgi:hypothetical protein
MGRNILMYFSWSRPDEEGAPLGNLHNRFGALFELRRLQWPKYEALADLERFDQGVAGFLDHVLLQKSCSMAISSTASTYSSSSASIRSARVNIPMKASWRRFVNF